ncbi:nicotinate-nucleotide--dimethylbenzimidazole phosphoribosyltransferase [Halorhodospira halochloris]|uniref:nicotinate-nucleotide--dimethylbenzimidazole phosphoribosyltransferase n=1 Tax=Halorhodospira halochloris TaxID=1052 RepID=UPI001EE7938B|nr:nicotinate-nucleotide--dimethylbenzimidazole phosphoribosyltransferase [Halorhodospira halochloris]
MENSHQQPNWLQESPAQPSLTHRERALEHQDQLTKPPGSLGELEALAVQLAAIQNSHNPAAEPAHIALFAADHGITAEGVSPIDPVVTQQMMTNFVNGGAAISVMARELGCELEVIDVGSRWPGELPQPIRDRRIAPGTANMRREAAMSPEQFLAALEAGREAAERAQQSGVKLFIAGEMGIGNTSAAAALAAALLEAPAAGLVGPGTGLQGPALRHKEEVIEAALNFHRHELGSPGALANPWEAGRRVGGLEICAMAGAYLRCAQLGIAVLLDGYISGSAALLAERLAPGTKENMLLGHCSAEPGHRRVVSALGLSPILSLGMRLGEGSGAATALPLLRMACAIHNNMATFAQAGVTQGDNHQ